MRWFLDFIDRRTERAVRGVAQQYGRRSMLAKLGKGLVGGALLPMLPFDRSAQAAPVREALHEPVPEPLPSPVLGAAAAMFLRCCVWTARCPMRRAWPGGRAMGFPVRLRMPSRRPPMSRFGHACAAPLSAQRGWASTWPAVRAAARCSTAPGV